MEIGLHIADFTWPGGPSQLAVNLVEHVRQAESAGIARITVMDHVWQIHQVGPAENEMLEAYTALGFIAAHTRTVQLHTLVTAVTYRAPGLLAKAISTLDVLSGGRAGLGIGAGWNADESSGLGLLFPGAGERLDRLEETVQICLQMWSDSEAAYDGKYYQLARTLNSPQSVGRSRPYLMIGGGGEKRTLRIAAQYADACSITAPPAVAGHKLDVLRQHCDDLGRDEREIEKTCLFRLVPEMTRDDVLRTAIAYRDLGYTAAYVYAVGIPEPERIVELLGSVVPELG